MERRVILDLSYPRSNSVNDMISNESYVGVKTNLHYPVKDDLVRLIKIKGRGCHLFKKDLKRAYRQIPIDPCDIDKLGYERDGRFYFDRVLNMGLRSVFFICQKITSSVRFMFNNLGFALLNYLDDFAGAETPHRSREAYTALGDLLKKCGLRECPDKSCEPSTVLLFLGLLYDTVNLTISTDNQRLEEIGCLLQEWDIKTEASLREVQSLVGKLNFVASCVRPG